MKISVARTHIGAEKSDLAKSISRFWLCTLALLVICGAITVARSQPSEAQLIEQAGPKPGPAVGQAAIAFNLQTFDGKSITLETFRGKPLVLNFFASWCDPCRDEMPLINELAAKEEYRVLGIAVEDTRAAITEFSKEARLIFPIALDLNNTVKRSYRIFGPPATFFIDRQGVIRDVVLGPITRERAREALKKAGVF
jgi:cytochrome c biogenesis protein CcmG, thiol:disulfide interchange protein DsbE